MHARDRTTPVVLPVHRAAQMRRRTVTAIDFQADRLDGVRRGQHPGDHCVVAGQELANSPVGDGQRLQVGDGVQHALVARLRAKPFVPYTTNSRHEFPIVPNLVRGLVPTGIDQIWVADITYIRLATQFIYLAVVLDAHSRKVVGWALADHLEASLAVEALDMALAARRPARGLIHHSDRGVQYACHEYRERLEAHGVKTSMSRAGNPYDNAKAERFMRTLKEEEVNAKTYATIEEARADIGAFIENVYNRGRLHSALGYKPPVEFEADLARLATV